MLLAARKPGLCVGSYNDSGISGNNSDLEMRRSACGILACWHGLSTFALIPYCNPFTTTVMSLTPHSDPLVSLQLSRTPTPIGTLGHTGNSSGSESSSRTVMPATRSHTQENVLAARNATPAKRNRVSQRPKKSRSKLSGLATPFHIDIRRRPQGVLPSTRLPSQTLKGRTQERQHITDIDTVGNESAIMRSLTDTNPQRVRPDMASVALLG